MSEKFNPTKFEQELAHMRDTFPRVWWTLYSGAIQAGFKTSQAMVLLQTWILAQNPNGIRPPDSFQPPTPQEE